MLSLTADRPLSGWAVTGVSLRRGVWSDPHRGAPPGTFRAANPFNTVNASRHPNANIASSPAAIAYDGRQHAWASAGRNGTHVIGDPFRQAEAAIHALVREIGQHQIFGTDPPSFAWSHCVAFPDCRYDPQGVPTKCSADLVIDGGKLLQLKDCVTTIMARRAGQHQPRCACVTCSRGWVRCSKAQAACETSAEAPISGILVRTPDAVIPSEGGAAPICTPPGQSGCGTLRSRGNETCVPGSA